jgi:hypothetical protein
VHEISPIHGTNRTTLARDIRTLSFNTPPVPPVEIDVDAESFTGATRTYPRVSEIGHRASALGTTGRAGQCWQSDHR